jgi:hypothetical protein
LLHHLGAIEGEDVLQAANTLVTERVEQRERSGEVEFVLSIQPHIDTVDMSGFQVVLVGKDSRGCLPIRPTQTDSSGRVVFQHLSPGKYRFTQPQLIWAPVESIPFRQVAAGRSGPLAAASVRTRGRPARWRFPETLDEESPLECSLVETPSGEFVLRAHLRTPVDGTPRVAYVFVEESSEKIAVVVREQEHVELKGEITLDKLPQGGWIGQVNLGRHLAEALGVKLEGPRYRLRAFVIGGEEAI